MLTLLRRQPFLQLPRYPILVIGGDDASIVLPSHPRLAAQVVRLAAHDARTVLAQRLLSSGLCADIYPVVTANQHERLCKPAPEHFHLHDHLVADPHPGST